MKTAAIGRVVVLFGFVAVPAFGQSRVYTNADLGKPIQWTAPPPTAELLADLRAHRFVAPPEIGNGPTVTIISSSATDGPFGPLYSTPIAPLSPPWWTGNHFGHAHLNAFGGRAWRVGERPQFVAPPFQSVPVSLGIPAIVPPLTVASTHRQRGSRR